MAQLDHHEVAVAAAFLFRGACVHIDATQARGCGFIELADEVCKFAPLVEEVFQELVVDGDFPGIWLYDVVGPFGGWLGLQIAENGEINRGQADAVLRELVAACLGEG